MIIAKSSGLHWDRPNCVRNREFGCNAPARMTRGFTRLGAYRINRALAKQLARSIVNLEIEKEEQAESLIKTFKKLVRKYASVWVDVAEYEQAFYGEIRTKHPKLIKLFGYTPPDELLKILRSTRNGKLLLDWLRSTAPRIRANCDRC